MTRRLKILHLEDVELDAELVRRVLQKDGLNFEWLWVSNRSDYIHALKDFQPDIILSDHSLPGFNSLEALKILQADGSDKPFILVTSTVSEEFAVSIIKSGADDFILKDRMQRLPGAIRSAIEKHAADLERKASHEQLLKSEANLTSIIENTDAFIHSLDINLNYVTFNKLLKDAMKNIYGVDIAPGMKVFGFLGPDNKTEIEEWERIYQIVLEGGTQQFVKDYSTLENKVYISFSINPIREREKVIGITCFSRDITVEHIAQEEKATMVSQLMKQNDDLKQFSFIASHNLRGPVASMLGLINLLNKQDLKGDSLDLLSHLKQSAENLDDIVTDISLILSIRATDIHLIKQIGIRKILLVVRELLARQIHESHAMIDLVSDMDFFTVESYFQDILFSLLSNAIKFRSPERPLKITIATFENETTQGFTVRDNGLGIDLEKFGAKIFGLYQRFHLHIEGKGLGLHMVKTQVQALNGSIRVESILGEGSVFYVQFPK